MNVKNRPVLLTMGCLVLSCGIAVAQQPAACPEAPTYGNNADAGAFAKVNGISLHYESYGQGAPLLVIHGNGGSSNGLRCQISFFSVTRRVIAADSRAHGRSEDGTGPLTYDQIADDLAELIKTLGLERTDVLGHSDGGIVALLLAIRHPDRVGKVIASAANLRPEALSAKSLEGMRANVQQADQMLKAGDRSRDWNRRKRQVEMMIQEPHITRADLQKISVPTLIMGGDADLLVPLSHTIEIFEGIPRAQLFIVPGAGHGLPGGQFDLYNFVAARFLDRTFSARLPDSVGPP